MLAPPPSQKRRDLKSSQQLLDEFLNGPAPQPDIQQSQQSQRFSPFLPKQSNIQMVQSQNVQEFPQQIGLTETNKASFQPFQSINFLQTQQSQAKQLPVHSNFEPAKSEIDGRDLNWDDFFRSASDEKKQPEAIVQKPEQNALAVSRVQLNEIELKQAKKRNELLANLEFEYFSPGSSKIANPAIILRDGARYEGETKETQGQAIYHGRGKLIQKNGDIYIGQFFQGLFHGKGLLIVKADGSYYDGNFISGEKNGQGEQHFANGNVYIGQFQNGIMHDDKAQYIVDKENATYKVPYFEGNMHGQGCVEVKSNNDLTKTQKPVVFHQGIQHDVYDDQEDEVVKRAHRKHEDLIQIDAVIETDHLLQEFKKEMYDEADYLGIEIIKENKRGGAFYEGPKQNQLMGGKAIYHFPNGNISAGEWENGKQSGQGLYFDVAVGLYKGNFHQGLKEGYGVFNYNNGDVYEGNWQNDLKHSRNATYTAFRKNIRLVGRAENGQFISISQQSLSSKARS